MAEEIKTTAAKAVKATKELRPQEKRRQRLIRSFYLVVLLPTLLGSIYFLFIASDRYIATVGFAVRGMEAKGSDIIGSFTGLASTGSTASDSYIILKFVKSHDIVERLTKDYPFREAYSNSGIDFLSRLDQDDAMEIVIDYWSRYIHTSYDNSSGILNFEIEAFTPEDAFKIAELVLKYCKDLVNDLSSIARKDAVSYAESEVERAEERLRAALESVRIFRSQKQAIDPSKIAQSKLELVAGLEKQLAETQARITSLEGLVDSDSPALVNLHRMAEALISQIATVNEQTSLGDDEQDSNALTKLLATYETLEIERNFAQQSYISSLASLEKARIEADRQQRYLAVYSYPALPEYPLYPRRLLNCFLVLISAILIWGVGALLVYSVRDHVA